ncbi:hypothetical protein TIFTF001_053326 [Ficus carica]|uniref:Uncharacterized protein n=1 Tax=Ficus carica TaxID=3494 RepID=A0AA87Z1W6_FICCA|nr:hypothetical protein TIFTF001_051556 [Ficus carica]GMN70923.1 hypothetical protein TIFTF001_053326 [Ficus carica]
MVGMIVGNMIDDCQVSSTMPEILPQEAKVDADAKERPGRDFI